MSFKLPQSAFGGVLVLAMALVGGAASAQPAPPRPPGQHPPQTHPPPAGVAAVTLPPPGEGARPGTVTVLKGGQATGLGMVLAADGRVLASRTSLGGNRKNLALRFQDGSQVAAEIGHEDPASDLVLLVPVKAGWTRGLTPGSAQPADGAALDSFELKGNRPEPRVVRTKGAAGPGGVLVDVAGPQVLGSPAVDASGQAVGVIVQACDPGEGKACKPRTRLATVPVLRAFLRGIPASAAIPTAYLGVRAERAVGSFARGVRVLEVAPGSPAALAKLQSGPEGDLLLAVAGEPVTSSEELTRVLRKHGVGEKVSLTLFTKAGYRQADVQLTRPPGAAAAAGKAVPPGSGPPPPLPATPRPPGPPARSPSDGAPKDFGGPR